VLLYNPVERRTLLTDVVATAGADDLRVKQKYESVETAETITFVERSVFCQQLGAFHVLFDLLLDSPVIYTHRSTGRILKV